MQQPQSKPKGKGGLMLPSHEVMAKLERSLVQNSPPNFASPAAESAPAEPSSVKEAIETVEKVNPEQVTLTRDNPPKAKKTAVEALPAPTHGKRVRLSVYVTPEEAGIIRKLAAEADRSESYMGGELITQALKARPKR
jgi:hypothetical protein